jgi:hypothetical protein
MSPRKSPRTKKELPKSSEYERNRRRSSDHRESSRSQEQSLFSSHDSSKSTEILERNSKERKDLLGVPRIEKSGELRKSPEPSPRNGIQRNPVNHGFKIQIPKSTETHCQDECGSATPTTATSRPNSPKGKSEDIYSIVENLKKPSEDPANHSGTTNPILPTEKQPSSSVEDWDIDQVCLWLASLKIPEKFQQVFRDEYITGNVLFSLNENDLTQMKLPIGIRLSFARGIDALKQREQENNC